MQREELEDATTAATLVVEIPGKPGDLDGRHHLAADGDGTVETVAGDVKVKVPVIGGKLEGLIGRPAAAALGTEQQVGRAWLAAKDA